LKAGKEAGEFQRWISTISHVDGLERLTKLGVKVNVVKDRQAFVDKVKPVWDKYKQQIGEKWFDSIVNTK